MINAYAIINHALAYNFLFRLPIIEQRRDIFALHIFQTPKEIFNLTSLLLLFEWCMYEEEDKITDFYSCGNLKCLNDCRLMYDFQHDITQSDIPKYSFKTLQNFQHLLLDLPLS